MVAFLARLVPPASLRTAAPHTLPRRALQAQLALWRRLLQAGAELAVLPPQRLPVDAPVCADPAAWADDDPALLTQAWAPMPLSGSGRLVGPAQRDGHGPAYQPGNGGGWNALADPQSVVAALRHWWADLELVPPLPAGTHLRDSGALNTLDLGDGAIHVYQDAAAAAPGIKRPSKRWSQSREAALHSLRLLQVRAGRSLVCRQDPRSVAVGGWHAGLCAIAGAERLLLADRTLLDQSTVLTRLEELAPRSRVHVVPARHLTQEEFRAAFAGACFCPRGDGVQLFSGPLGKPAERLVQRLLAAGFIDGHVLVPAGHTSGWELPLPADLRVPEAARVDPSMLDQLDGLAEQVPERWSRTDACDPQRVAMIADLTTQLSACLPGSG